MPKGTLLYGLPRSQQREELPRQGLPCQATQAKNFLWKTPQSSWCLECHRLSGLIQLHFFLLLTGYSAGPMIPLYPTDYWCCRKNSFIDFKLYIFHTFNSANSMTHLLYFNSARGRITWSGGSSAKWRTPRTSSRSCCPNRVNLTS